MPLFSRFGKRGACVDVSHEAKTPVNHATGMEGVENVTPDAQADLKDVKNFSASIVSDDLEKEAAGNLDDDPELKDIPRLVRDTVSLEDDPNALTVTFRYWLLSVCFVIPGAFLSQMSYFRTTSAPYSVFFVQIACHYAGHFLARVLPAKRVTIPFTDIGFSLNPGPWSMKEHVLVTITAASGATYNLGYTPIVLSEMYYDEVINPAVAIFFMYAIVWAGYSFAALARQFLIYDPIYIWPKALMQTNLFETFRHAHEDSGLARKQMRLFFLCFAGMTLWQFLPEYVFPMVSSLAFLCWVAPHNKVANFIGSGQGGMGFMNLSFDWSNITSSVMLMPFWTQVVVFAGFVVNCWLLLPLAKWGGLGSFDHGLMSTKVMLANGTTYPVTALLENGPDGPTLNQTAYDHYGPIYMGTQNIWATWSAYASYISAFTWIATFGYPNIRSAIDKLIERRRSGNKESINHKYNDRLNVLMRPYKEVPFWWYGVLFLVAFVSMVTILAKGYMFMPVWIYVVGLLFGATSVLPLGWLYAISNFQLATGDFNELMYGYMINAVTGHKHPAGASTYGAVAGDAWYRAQYILQDQKIGHYMHIPPRLVFMSQVFGELIGIPINYAVCRWIMKTKGDYISGKKTDPLHQWTGQSLSKSNTLGVQYVLVGPARLFKEHLYKPLPWAFLAGAGLPLVLFALYKTFPRLSKKLKLHLWNVTIFFSSLSTFYGNISTGYFSSFVAGFIVMYWIYRYRFQLWTRYNYLVAAAFDAGFNLNMLLIFIFFSAGKTVTMPNWFGNNADSTERCFSLD